MMRRQGCIATQAATPRHDRFVIGVRYGVVRLYPIRLWRVLVKQNGRSTEMSSLKRILLVCLVLVTGALAVGQMSAPQRERLPARSGPSLASVKAWGYQLQGARADLQPPEIDLLVIDHARDASATDILQAADVDAFRRRPGSEPRIVLAYMSIGEAESYRYYWWKPWISISYFGLLRPAWLGRENKDWAGNYQVRYWQPGWQRVIVQPQPSLSDMVRERAFGRAKPYIDKVMEAGFDGVYLDRVDAFSAWDKSQPAAEAEMSAFVERISAYAKARKPGFLIVPQNGEELLQRATYRRAIDGIAKEDLMFGLEGPETENAADEYEHASAALNRARMGGLPVFVVEYVTAPEKRAASHARMKEKRFVVTFGSRELNAPPPVPVVPSQPLSQVPPGATPPPQR
jgi:cysteinyl-tRNA synthetase, unknown class